MIHCFWQLSYQNRYVVDMFAQQDDIGLTDAIREVRESRDT